MIIQTKNNDVHYDNENKEVNKIQQWHCIPKVILYKV